MEHLGYLFAAYSIIFVAIFLYVLFIWRRQLKLEAELREIESQVRDLPDLPERPAPQSAPDSTR